jgi:hypothetical protein
MTIKTDTQYNFTSAENDLFTWSMLEPDFLTHKPTGRQIYQMQ